MYISYTNLLKKQYHNIAHNSILRLILNSYYIQFYILYKLQNKYMLLSMSSEYTILYYYTNCIFNMLRIHINIIFIYGYNLYKLSFLDYQALPLSLLLLIRYYKINHCTRVGLVVFNTKEGIGRHTFTLNVGLSYIHIACEYKYLYN